MSVPITLTRYRTRRRLRCVAGTLFGLVLIVAGLPLRALAACRKAWRA